MRHLLATILLWAFAQYIPTVPVAQSGGGSGGNITLGTTSGTTNDGGGDSGEMIYVPFIANTNASGYTVSSLHANFITVAAAHWGLGLYGSTSSGCPTGYNFCPGSRLCSTVVTSSPVSGDNSLSPASCGTLSANTYYWIAVIVNSNTPTYDFNPNGCTGTGAISVFNAITFPGTGANTYPATAATTSAVSAPTGCHVLSAVLTCVAACGSSGNPEMFFDMAGETSGTTVSGANVITGNHGYFGTWAVTAAALTYTNAQSQNALTSITINGSSFAGTSGISMQRATPSNTDKIVFTPEATFPNSTIGMWVRTDYTPASGEACDFTEIGSTGDALTIQFANPGTGMVIRVEQTPGSTTHVPITVSANTWYWVTLQLVSGGSHQFAVYNTSGTQLGSGSFAAGGADTTSNFTFGSLGTCWTATSKIWYSNIKLDPTGSLSAILP